MKAFIVLALIVGGIVATLWTIRSREDRAHAIRMAQSEYEHGVFERDRAMKSAILSEEIKIVRLRFGNAAAAEYELCRTVAPTVKANQLRCAKLIDRVKRAEANQPKW